MVTSSEPRSEVASHQPRENGHRNDGLELQGRVPQYQADARPTYNGQNQGVYQAVGISDGPRSAPAPPPLPHSHDSAHGPGGQMASSVAGAPMPPGFDQRAIQGSTLSRPYYSTQMPPMPGPHEQRQDTMSSSHVMHGQMMPNDQMNHSHGVGHGQMPGGPYSTGSVMNTMTHGHMHRNSQGQILSPNQHPQQMPGSQNMPHQQPAHNPQHHPYEPQHAGMPVHMGPNHAGGYIPQQHMQPPHGSMQSNGPPMSTNHQPDGRNFSQMVLAQSMGTGGSPMSGGLNPAAMGLDYSPPGGSHDGKDPQQPLVLSRTDALAALGVDPGAWHSMGHVRRRVAVTGQVKKEICQLKEQLGDVSQDEMVEQVFRKYQVRLSRTTVSKILKDADKWLQVTGVAAKQKRCRAAKFPDLEKSLALWYQQVSAMHAPVSDAMIVDKARSLAMELSIAPEDFKVSDGWLYRFKRRHELPTSRKRGLGGGQMDDMKPLNGPPHMYLEGPPHQGYHQPLGGIPHQLHPPGMHQQHHHAMAPPPHNLQNPGGPNMASHTGMPHQHSQNLHPSMAGGGMMVRQDQVQGGGQMGSSMQHHMQHQSQQDQHQHQQYEQQQGGDGGNLDESESLEDDEEEEEEEEMEVVEQVASDLKRKSGWGASLSAADRERYEQVRSLFAGTLKKLENYPRL